MQEGKNGRIWHNMDKKRDGEIILTNHSDF